MGENGGMSRRKVTGVGAATLASAAFSDLAAGPADAAGSLLVDFNVLFKLNKNGLRDNITPLVGIEYSF